MSGSPTFDTEKKTPLPTGRRSNEAQTSYNLRNNQTGITLPNPKTKCFNEPRGQAKGAKLWNSLPQHLKVAAFISSLKNMIADFEMNCT